ncbi:HlyD family secretion protein [Flavihumibacter solisilvae]|uniref:Hemolysin D n=1 Tax=Flavihumibacter solisilvae TaxID=1349421 RepID=A0A0C1L4I6_9BACT|nr:HlyD family secretion protein [Flavihumibacter solisilvae]KIC95017.1 hemolysin D [Flavihumibacter solisilvae]
MKLLNGKSRALLLVNTLIFIAAGTVITWGVYKWSDLWGRLYTNDAQVEEYINPVNTRIPGYIKEVRFTEHQQIKKGDTLVLIDDREYKIQVEQAEAAYLAAQASRTVTASAVNTVESGLAVTDANISAARARLWNAEENLRRYTNLLAEGAATQQQFDQVKTEYDVASSQSSALFRQRNATSLSAVETGKKVSVNDAEIKRTHAALDLAKLNLSYTVITAPYDGVTGRRNIQEGQLLQAGQNLLSYVRKDSKWVVANYKETQIAKLRVGQRMKLKIDGIPGKEFSGTISAISQATGSRFAAIPTDNSAGNFIKVQQRIPVKIEFNDYQSLVLDHVMAGMNVEVSIAD